jgi:bacillithiol system protein YtxJ
MNWVALTQLAQLSDIQESSSSSAIRAILIFKHSTRCSISGMALNRLESSWQNQETIPVYFLDLLQHRDISNQLAAIFEVEHQSPQVLLIKNGKCVYHASHSSIRVQSILDAV